MMLEESGGPRRLPRSAIGGVGAEIAGTPPQTPTLHGEGFRCNSEQPATPAALAQWQGNRDGSQRQAQAAPAGVSEARSAGRLSAVWTMLRRYGFPDSGQSRSDARSSSSSRGSEARVLRDQEHNEELFARLQAARREPGGRHANGIRSSSEAASAQLARRSAGGSRGSGRSSRFLASHDAGAARERNSDNIDFVDMEVPIIWDRDRGRVGSDDRAGGVPRALDFSSSSNVAHRQMRSNNTGALPDANPLSFARGIDYGAMPFAGHQFFQIDVAAEERAMHDAIEQSRMAHLLSELPCELYQPDQHKDLTECEVCLVDYEQGDELLRLPCMHIFHKACVSPWLRKAHTCPVCQVDIFQVIGF